MTSEQDERVLREFLDELPEGLHALVYQKGREPGEEPAPIMPTKVARQLVDWMLQKGYTSTRTAQRIQRVLHEMEARAQPGCETRVLALNMLSLLR